MNCSTLTGPSFITCAGQGLNGAKGIRVIEHSHAKLKRFGNCEGSLDVAEALDRTGLL
jgi:hypothetical protein